MKAVACQSSQLEVVELPDPRPGPGQVLVEVIRCGICGSDLHARHHADEQADVLAEAGYDGFMRSDQRVVLGHEFVGEVSGYGPETRKKIPAGTAVVAVPLTRYVRTTQGAHTNANATRSTSTAAPRRRKATAA